LGNYSTAQWSTPIDSRVPSTPFRVSDANRQIGDVPMSAGLISTELIARAGALPIEGEIERRGIKLRGRVEREGPCPVCGGTDRFAINIRKQQWNCRGCRVGGGIIGLVQHLDGVGFRQAIETLTGERSFSSTPVNSNINHNLPHADHYVREQHQKAAWLWSRRAPLTGSVAECYLRGARGIDCPFPATLAYLPPTKPDHRPALIAAYGVLDEPEPSVLAEPVNINAVHLILLKSDGSGKVDVKPNKLTIGSPAGQPIVLAPVNDLLGLAITEGIEDALSLHAASGVGAWAAGGASHMPALAAAVPDYVDWFRVVADGDEAGRSNSFKLCRSLSDRGLRGEVIDLSGCSDAAR
jgi:putative DNA primase/helicase